jgi:hypothetical protein
MIIRSPNKEAHLGEHQICLDEACGHDDCARLRAQTREKCRFCQKYLGFDREYRDNPDGPGFVHTSCVWKFARQAVVKSVLVRERVITAVVTMRWHRLSLHCGHETFLRLSSNTKAKIPKTTTCLTCKVQTRDAHGNLRFTSPIKSPAQREAERRAHEG